MKKIIGLCAIIFAWGGIASCKPMQDRRIDINNAGAYYALADIVSAHNPHAGSRGVRSGKGNWRDFLRQHKNHYKIRGFADEN